MSLLVFLSFLNCIIDVPQRDASNRLERRSRLP